MSTTIKSPARRLSESDVQEMIEVRRDLHAHPETAFQEVRTSGFVTGRLRALGLEPRTGLGRTGVIADIRGSSARTLLLRADMDALPIQEENDVPYRSQNDGAMHACGHDCHTSILLAVAQQLTREAASLPGTIRLCFQPAEEGGGGALAMIRDGAMESPRTDLALGLHVWQDLDLGKVGVTPGPFMAAVDEFTVKVFGKGAHAAMPHEGRDPIVCLAHVVTALQSIASRQADPFKEVVVSVTQIKAGTAFNIIPESAWMNGTVRVFDSALWEELPARFERVVQGVAAAFDCRAEIEYQRAHRPTVNDPKVAAVVREAAAEVVGEENVLDNIRTMGGKDFSEFLHRAPGCFFAVGSRNEAKGLVYGHHHPRFDVDERCLGIGAEIMLRATYKLLGG